MLDWNSTRREDNKARVGREKRNKSGCLQPEPLKEKRKYGSKRRGGGFQTSKVLTGKVSRKREGSPEMQGTGLKSTGAGWKVPEEVCRTWVARNQHVVVCYCLKLRIKGCFCSLKS
ncbi:unnamed protein product [Trifolium pratense]|uniref:Uncharacterized protein n=1 Tax=Trifolium pratense TaxID=57577 RepID=A0ACB0M1A3_TRIPR|nr:unnamed protein product [Trifolium pratense]